MIIAWSRLKDNFVKLIKNDEMMFRLGVGFKFLFVTLACLLSLYVFFGLVTQIFLNFFIANGYPGAVEFKDAFFDFVYFSVIAELHWILFAVSLIFFVGFYLSSIMLRPFKIIATYCESRMNDSSAFYSADFLSNLKFLTQFAIFFFNKVGEAEIKGKLEKVVIPNHFTKIHKPKFESSFFFNYLLVVIIFGLISSVGILLFSFELREQVLILAKKFLSDKQSITYFLDQQFILIDIGMYCLLGLHMFFYLLLGINMYNKISAPSFAIFATMRSFLKGNYHNRIHLIGYYYLREDCRKINKYLDHIQKKFTNS